MPNNRNQSMAEQRRDKQKLSVDLTLLNNRKEKH